MDILGLAKHGLNNFEQIAILCVVLIAISPGICLVAARQCLKEG